MREEVRETTDKRGDARRVGEVARESNEIIAGLSCEGVADGG